MQAGAHISHIFRIFYTQSPDSRCFDLIRCSQKSWSEDPQNQLFKGDENISK